MKGHDLDTIINDSFRGGAGNDLDTTPSFILIRLIHQLILLCIIGGKLILIPSFSLVISHIEIHHKYNY
jgi:hypothetical protein